MFRRIRSTIEPCLPRPAKEPPNGDGFRILARRDAEGVRLYTRNGYNFANRFPRIVEAVETLAVPSCFNDGEAIVVDRNGLSVFDMIRYRRHDRAAVLCAFDLIELNGEDLRSARIEDRKQALAEALRHRESRIVLNVTTRATARSSTSTPARSAARVLYRNGSGSTIARAGSLIGKIKNPDAPAVRREAEEVGALSAKPEGHYCWLACGFCVHRLHEFLCVVCPRLLSRLPSAPGAQVP